MSAVNTQLLVLARESRGWSQPRLADECGLSQSFISKAENDLIDVGYEHLETLARALRYPSEFFRQDEETAAVDVLFHRRLRSVKVTALRQIQAQINAMRIHVKRLLRGVQFDTPYVFPRFDVDEVGGPERAAQLVRRAWKLPLGPVANVTRAIEAAGGIVVPITISTEKLSAAAQWPRREERPYFFVNAAHSTDRQRFSLAHEVAHMVLHAYPEDEQEEQADRFASEFLMPETEIRPQLKGKLTPARLVELKRYWKVSMAALIKRAGQLGVITADRATSLYKMLSAKGWRRVEPAPLAPEPPEMLMDILRLHRQQHAYSTADLSQLALLTDDEFTANFGAYDVARHDPPPRGGLYAVP